MADRDPLAEVLTESLNIVGPLRRIFGEPGAQIVDALEVLLAQEIEHAAHQVRAFLASDETVERVAFAIFAEHEPAFAHQEERTRLWHTLLGQFRDAARAALAAATEVRHGSPEATSAPESAEQPTDGGSDVRGGEGL